MVHTAHLPTDLSPTSGHNGVGFSGVRRTVVGGVEGGGGWRRVIFLDDTTGPQNMNLNRRI